MPSVVVIGDVAYDLLVEAREPLASGADTPARMHARPGGAGANQAAWLARCGVETHLVGRVGSDVFGLHLVDELREDGVITHLATDARQPTGRIVILVNGAGERTMITDRAANLCITVDDLPADLWRTGGHLHLSGYCFFEDGPRTVALEALRRARAAGMTVSVDPASVSLLREVGPHRFLRWTRDADLCFPNSEEGMLLSGREAAPAIVATLGVHYGGVALKLGADGAVFGRGGHEPVFVPAGAAAVRDTTGAGDAFCAAFLAAWLAHSPPEDALRRGVELAARVVQQFGAR